MVLIPITQEWSIAAAGVTAFGVTFALTPQGTATQVTWAMQGPAPFISKVMQVFFNMDKMVGGDFEVGLAKLKTVAEK